MISMTSKTKHDRLICKMLDYVAHTLAELKNWNCKKSLGQGTLFTLSIANPFKFFFSVENKSRGGKNYRFYLVIKK